MRECFSTHTSAASQRFQIQVHVQNTTRIFKTDEKHNILKIVVKVFFTIWLAATASKQRR